VQGLSCSQFEGTVSVTLKGLMETKKTSVMIAGTPGRESKSRSLEYEAGILTTQERHSVTLLRSAANVKKRMKQ
jgi:hypothetical protein